MTSRSAPVFILLCACSVTVTCLPATGSPLPPSPTPLRNTVAPPDVHVASQHAVYELGLVESAGRQTLSATGSMNYVIQQTCTGWTTRQRLDIESVTKAHGPERMVAEYTAQESADGRHLMFVTQEIHDGVLAQTVSGQASLNPDGSGRVTYDRPLAKSLSLPAGTLFPIAHMRAIILAARNGRTELATPLFDGTLPDGPEDTYATLLGWAIPPANDILPALNGLAATRVHIAFFDRAAQSMTPTYEIGMRYFANGVSDRLDMDFGDYRMKGALKKLTLSEPACPRTHQARTRPTKPDTPR
ncbi:MAG: DUF1849 family protein [Acetobacter sp.]|uniref:EipB family protein n=1 Tax=Acetobacter sp. TaxID=440 RepID=UPI0039E7F835